MPKVTRQQLVDSGDVIAESLALLINDPVIAAYQEKLWGETYAFEDCEALKEWDELVGSIQRESPPEDIEYEIELSKEIRKDPSYGNEYVRTGEGNGYVQISDIKGGFAATITEAKWLSWEKI